MLSCAPLLAEKRRTTIYITAELKERVEALANAEFRSFTAQVELCLTRCVEQAIADGVIELDA